MPIKKFTIEGQRAWALAHIDSVIDDDGRTLREILGEIPSASSVQAEIDKIIKGAPEALDTLKEIDDYITVNGYDSIPAALNDKANVSSVPTKVSDLPNDAGYVNQLKTINGIELEGTGNIAISGSGTGDVVAGDIVGEV